MPTHLTLSDSHPNRDGRPRRHAFVVAAVTASLVFGPALLAAPAAFGAESPSADPAISMPAVAADQAVAADSAAAPVDAPAADAAPAADPALAAAALAPESVAPAADAAAAASAVVDPAAAVAPAAEAAAADPGLVIAFAVLPFSVITPSEGAVTNDFGNLVFFDGTGTSDNTITVTYDNAVGGVSTAGVGTVDVDGLFSVLTNFSELAGGQTDVTVTVTETDALGVAVGAPILRSFSFLVPPVEEFPFAVTSPAQGETVLTTTPTFTGTGTPGDTVVIAYTDVNLEDAIAGQTIVAADGTFSVLTTFLGLAPGVVEVRTLSTGFSPTGVELVTGRIATLFFFDIAPVFLANAASITIIPGSLTVSDVTNINRGVRLAATGFERNEALTTTVTGPNGAAVTLAATAAANADVNGSITDVLVLAGTVAPGEYTVTVTGALSGLEQSVVFTVVADPITAPVVTVTPAGVSVVAVNPSSATPITSLARTGTDESTLMGLTAFAAIFTLVGGAILVLRRKYASRVSVGVES